jgi:hypothetical protein
LAAPIPLRQECTLPKERLPTPSVQGALDRDDKTDLLVFHFQSFRKRKTRLSRLDILETIRLQEVIIVQKLNPVADWELVVSDDASG